MAALTTAARAQPPASGWCAGVGLGGHDARPRGGRGGTRVRSWDDVALPFGNLGVRVGGGAGELRERIEPTGSLTLLYGVRSVVARYSWGGGCVEGSRVRVTEPGQPRRTLALASGARLFATVRADRDGNALWLVGIELEPGFLLPPYSLARFGGGRPD